ncbi:serine/threonine-protein kinase [Stieleria varia]|nr:serine/threonine-protein kinase [Stieleria varia]
MSEKLCPRCQTPIPESQIPESRESRPENASDDAEMVLPGQCPRCLLRPDWDKPHPVAITLGPGQSFIPPSIEELAQHITGYEVLSRIGQGGMGAVYLGRQLSLDRPVAIKILPPQIAQRPGFRERFAREGRALARLNHPNIVAVHDFGQAGPYAMLVMELVEGANLREVLAQGRLSQMEALEIIPQLCDALSYAHGEGVVHRDIKPENLLFDARGRLKITDFGLAKLLSSKSLSDGHQQPSDEEVSSAPDPTQGIVGTLHYMAPEQLENPGSVDHRADIYAIGVVFYEMLTGELPIGRFQPPSQVRAKGQSEGPPTVTIDVRLDEVVLRSLEKKPERRYASASDVRHDIDEIGKNPSPDERSTESTHRRRVQETIHQTSEVVSGLAASSYDATSSWVRSAKESWLQNPRVDGPAYCAMGVATVGGLIALMFSTQRFGEVPAMFTLLLSGLIALIFARVALSRESLTTESRENWTAGRIGTRIVLAIVYLMLAAPLVLVPMIGTFAGWSEFYGFPRDIGDVGWLRDWGQAVSITTCVASGFWLVILLVHLFFPSLLSFIFKPFVKPFSARVAIPLTITLAMLMTAGVVTFQQSAYRSYVPGEDVPREQWDELSREDLMTLQQELKRTAKSAS